MAPIALLDRVKTPKFHSLSLSFFQFLSSWKIFRNEYSNSERHSALHALAFLSLSTVSSLISSFLLLKGFANIGAFLLKLVSNHSMTEGSHLPRCSCYSLHMMTGKKNGVRAVGSIHDLGRTHYKLRGLGYVPPKEITQNLY